jgi:hypothetical protein
MTKTVHRLLFLAGLLAIPATPLLAQTKQISGNAGIVGVTVTLGGICTAGTTCTGTPAASDSAGAYGPITIQNPSGAYTVTATKSGCTFTGSITRGNGTCVANVCTVTFGGDATVNFNPVCPTNTPTLTPTVTPTPTRTPTPTSTPTPTNTPTPTPTSTPTVTPTFTPTPTNTPTPTRTPVPTPVPTSTPVSEGYDPLRLISVQSTKANLMIVLDTSADMAKGIDGSSVGSCSTFFNVSSPPLYCHTGDWGSAAGNTVPASNPQAQSQETSNASTSLVDWPGGVSWIRYGDDGTGGGCSNGGRQCHRWRYALQYMPPSRMAMIKNALGSSVNVVTSYSAPGSWPSYQGQWGSASTSATCNPATTTCLSASQPNSYTWIFTLYSSANTSADPGNPFQTSGTIPDNTNTYDSSNKPKSGYGSSNSQSAQDLVGSTSAFVNWGLSTYPTSTTDATLESGANCSNGQASVLVPVDTTDSAGSGSKWVNVIEAFMAPNSTFTCISSSGSSASGACTTGNSSGTQYEYKGLAASGSSTTVAALNMIGTVLRDYKDGTNFTNYDAPAASVSVTRYVNRTATSPCAFGLLSTSGGCTAGTETPSADSKGSSCQRYYGVLLATAGTSVVCNTGNALWGTSCPSTTTGYPAGAAETINNISDISVTITNSDNTRTVRGAKVWVIGPSSTSATSDQLCELNRTAMAGATDRLAPSGDYGFDTTQDTTRLGTYQTDNGYAFYADARDISTAINTVYAPGSGDYPTSVPIPLASSILQAVDDTQVLLASTSYPSWEGHLRLIDYAQSGLQYVGCGDPNSSPTGRDTTNNTCTSTTLDLSTASVGSVYIQEDVSPNVYWQKQSSSQWVSVGTTPPTTGTNQYLWDAGYNLSNPNLPGNAVANPAYVSPANRKIYTWDSSGNLVAVNETNRSNGTLATIAQAYGMTSAQTNTYFTSSFVDFIRGGDGNGTGATRCWVLGPLVNSAPAIIADPPTFSNFIGTAEDHTQFAHAVANTTPSGYKRAAVVGANSTTYTGRTPLIWVGSDDGMAHAFALEESSLGAGDAGREVLALVPPNMFSALYNLYYNYATYSTGCGDIYQTGQPASLSNHIYGVANSMRFADIYEPNGLSTNIPANNYRTVMFLTEGPGGDLVAAIDVTHPTSTDPGYGTFPSNSQTQYNGNCGSSQPVCVLWSYTGSTGPHVLTGLYSSWSIPAIGTGATDGSLWYAVLGSGQNSASIRTSQVDGTQFTLNALTGANLNSSGQRQGQILSNSGLTNTFVGQQGFASGVLFKRTGNGQKFDDVMDVGLQADLDGQIWGLAGTAFTSANNTSPILNASDVVNITLNTHTPPTANPNGSLGDYNLPTPSIGAAQTQPLYYSPTVSGIRSNTGCDIFAFGSGSINEKSSYVNGSNTGTPTTGSDFDGAHFVPSIFAASRPKSSGATTTVPSTSIVRTALASIHKVVKETSSTSANVGKDISPACASIGGDGCLSSSTQLSGPAIIAVPLSDTASTGQALGLFLVYDPAVSYKTCNSPTIDNNQTNGSNVRTCTSDNTINTCTGGTYVIFQAISPVLDTNGACLTGAPTISSTNAYFVGAGISSGMAIGKGNVLLVARSGSGTGSPATVVQTTSIPPVNPGGTSSVQPTWWQELK